MKFVTKLFLSLCLVIVGATLTANAQIRTDARIRANIPYSFVVNNTTLPAGAYVLTNADPYGTVQDVLEIRSEDGKTAVYFVTDPFSVPGSARATELVFDKIGNTYFLSRVFLEGDEGASQVLKSKTQRQLQEYGSNAECHSTDASPAQAKSSKYAQRKTN